MGRKGEVGKRDTATPATRPGRMSYCRARRRASDPNEACVRADEEAGQRDRFRSDGPKRRMRTLPQGGPR
jgi:hypothetical protein